MPVELTCDIKGASRYTSPLREEAEALLHLLGREDCELSILLTTDRRMKQLNGDYRFMYRPTDVLSFSQLEDGERDVFPAAPGEYRPPDSRPLGDVVISLETAARQARELRISTSARLRSLLIHGLLHLLGYDHEGSQPRAKAMFAYQNQLETLLEQVSKPSSTTPEQQG